MAVYVHLSKNEIAELLNAYSLGMVKRTDTIIGGIDNSNYLVTTNSDKYILTLTNKRISESDLAFHLGFMEHLSKGGIPVPKIIKNNSGELYSKDKKNYFVVTSFMEGHDAKDNYKNRVVSAAQMLANMHVKSKNFSMQNDNFMNINKCAKLIEECEDLPNKLENGLADFLKGEIEFLKTDLKKYAALPKGAVHADFFPDNVFFNEHNQACAVIDFYFSCTDYYVYDLMVAVNAWCFDARSCGDPNLIRKFINEYQKIRPLSAEEIESLPFFGRLAAMRICASRVHDWFKVPAGAIVNPHNPMQYIKILKSYLNGNTRIEL